MHWGVFAISAAHLYQNYLEEKILKIGQSETIDYGGHVC
jgi:hypothetical protein